MGAPVAVEDLPCLVARVALEPGHVQRVDDHVARHVLPQTPADHLAVVHERVGQSDVELLGKTVEVAKLKMERDVLKKAHQADVLAFPGQP